ncbi:hypothetical protein QEN29_23985 [Escherichia coli]|nr:hypothetical protein QEN29_23985 [Escherichia coli]
MSQVDVQPALYGKDFLSLKDFSINDIAYLIEKAEEMKQHPYQDLFKGKTLAMIFEKSSTRTRVSFEAGMTQLGGHALFLSSNDLQIGRGETIGDTAQVLSGYVDGIMIRTFEHEKVEELAKYGRVRRLSASAFGIRAAIKGKTRYCHSINGASYKAVG